MIFIRRIKWSFGYFLVCLGWKIYISGYTKTGNDLAYSIENDGVKYSIDFVAKERGGEK